jgi:hypothetical protein
LKSLGADTGPASGINSGDAQGIKSEAATEIIAAAIAGFQFRVLRVQPEDWDAARDRFLRHLLTTVWEGIGST